MLLRKSLIAVFVPLFIAGCATTPRTPETTTQQGKTTAQNAQKKPSAAETDSQKKVTPAAPKPKAKPADTKEAAAKRFVAGLADTEKLCGAEMTQEGGDIDLEFTDDKRSKACIAKLEKMSEDPNRDTAAFFSRTLGALYQSELGVSYDKAKTEYWLRRGALLGDPMAQFLLGLEFMDRERFIEAATWLNIAYNNRAETPAPVQEFLIKYKESPLPFNAQEKALINKRVKAYRPMTVQAANNELRRLGVTRTRASTDPVKKDIEPLEAPVKGRAGDAKGDEIYRRGGKDV